MPLHSRTMIKANVRAASIGRLCDYWSANTDGQLIWKEAQRDAFKSVRD